MDTPTEQRSKTADDSALVARMAAGDPTALRQFYDRHASVSYALCLRIIGNPQEAEEVLVDIFHEFWRRANTFDASRGSAVGMLVNLTRSRAIDRRRKTRSTPVAFEIQDYDAANAASDDPSKRMELAQETDRVRSALKTLQPEQRRAIECAYYDGMSHSEIASALGKPLGTVKTYIRQGLLRMRQVIGGAGGMT